MSPDEREEAAEAGAGGQEEGSGAPNEGPGGAVAEGATGAADEGTPDAAEAEVDGTAPGEGADGAPGAQGGGTTPGEEAATTTAPDQSGAAPDDANDLRGYHFEQLLRAPRTWVLIGGAAVILGLALAIAVSPVIGLITLGAVVLIGLWVTFMVADSKAADDFFHVYASKRGLTLGGKTRLPAATPLLRKGDDRYADRTLSGPIGPGLDGALVLFTYEDETTDSDGNQQTNYYHYTLGMAEVPECVERVPELYCQRKSGLRSLEKFEDVFRSSKERVKLESEVLDEKYEIFSAKSQSENWLRQLFSPTFIVWLCDSAPKKFAFELVNGTLVTYVNGHREDAVDLDEIARAAATVATRLREESIE